MNESTSAIVTIDHERAGYLPKIKKEAAPTIAIAKKILSVGMTSLVPNLKQQKRITPLTTAPIRVGTAPTPAPQASRVRPTVIVIKKYLSRCKGGAYFYP